MAASNPFNVAVPVIDFTHKHAPTSQTYHGVAIMVNGSIIGRIQNWQVTGVYTRTNTYIRELNYQTFGRFVDIVPGVVGEYKATAGRVEVWGEEFEKACGYTKVFEDMLDQTFPFSITEMWRKGNKPYRISNYHGCWFDQKEHDSWTADGTAQVMLNVSLSFVSKSILFGK